MDRNDFMWVIECCILNLDGMTKKEMLRFGASETLAEMGMQLCSWLKNKEIVVELKNGY